MKRTLKEQLRIHLMFSLVLLVIFAVTAVIMGVIGYFLMTSSLRAWLGSAPALTVVLVAVSGIIVGILVSLAIGHFPLQPVQEVIQAINRLGRGDFSVRIRVRNIPELREISESVNRTAEELGSLELLRSDFINTFSHEFKTPIVSIKGFTEMLKYADLTEQERQEYMDIIISEADRLSVLASNVLSLNKVETQTILSRGESFNLAEQIRRCVLLLEPKWSAKGLEMNILLDEVSISGDEELLRQMWLNLLDNAIKFSPENEVVELVLRRRGERVLFVISDRGCGISREELPHVFDKFYQSDKSRYTEGNGLGLAIVKRVVDLHGGTVECSSEPGAGSVFTVELPIK